MYVQMDELTLNMCVCACMCVCALCACVCNVCQLWWDSFVVLTSVHGFFSYPTCVYFSCFSLHFPHLFHTPSSRVPFEHLLFRVHFHKQHTLSLTHARVFTAPARSCHSHMHVYALFPSFLSQPPPSTLSVSLCLFRLRFVAWSTSPLKSL